MNPLKESRRIIENAESNFTLMSLLQCTSGNRGTSGPHLGAPVFELPRFPSAICVWSYGIDLSASVPVCGLPRFEGAPVFGSGLYI